VLEGALLFQLQHVLVLVAVAVAVGVAAAVAVAVAGLAGLAHRRMQIMVGWIMAGLRQHLLIQRH
jgi:hypothetical protein